MKDIKLIYGSQTGTAMSFAQQAGESAAALPHHPAVSVVDVSEYAHENALHLETGAIVLVLSCFGKGEPTDGAKRFYSWIMDPARAHLPGIPYAVFGCGSSKVCTREGASSLLPLSTALPV